MAPNSTKITPSRAMSCPIGPKPVKASTPGDLAGVVLTGTVVTGCLGGVVWLTVLTGIVVVGTGRGGAFTGGGSSVQLVPMLLVSHVPLLNSAHWTELSLLSK